MRIETKSVFTNTPFLIRKCPTSYEYFQLMNDARHYDLEHPNLKIQQAGDCVILVSGMLETDDAIETLSDIKDVHFTKYDNELFVYQIPNAEFLKALGGSIIEVLREQNAIMLVKGNIKYMMYFKVGDVDVNKFLDKCTASVGKNISVNQIMLAERFVPRLRLISNQYSRTIRDMLTSIFETTNFSNENSEHETT